MENTYPLLQGEDRHEITTKKRGFCTRGTACLASVAGLIVFLCGAFAFLKNGRTAQLVKFTINDAKYGFCNDGSPPAFYYRPAVTTQGRSNWVIMLEGGGQCGTQESCEKRDMNQKTSKNMANYSHLSGIFAAGEGPNAPASANLIYVKYCSSDGWHGDIDDPFPNSTQKEILKHFRGVRVIDQIFLVLMSEDRERPSQLALLEPSHKVLFGGFSAGGRGAMVNVDRIVKRFGLKNLRAFLDSPYYVLASTRLVEQTKNVYKNFVAGSDGARENNIERWEDLFGEFRMPKVETPYVLKASQFDGYQWHHNDDFVHETYSELTKLRPKDPCSVIFSDDPNNHAVGASLDFFQQSVGNVYLKDIMSAFAFGEKTSCTKHQVFIAKDGEHCKPCTPPSWFN